jgi:tRNA dimethylallyltransferase
LVENIMERMSKVEGRRSKVFIPVLAGATATGKTDLALRLGERFAIEVVSADASMVYRGMDIGTAKPGVEERSRVLHHLIDVLEPDQSFSVAEYLRHAEVAIEGILQRGKLPLVVGGTGYYIRALSDGLYDLPEPDELLQAELWKVVESEGIGPLLDELETASPEDAVRVQKNPRRIVRAIEILRRTGIPPARIPKLEPRFEYHKFILWPQWEWLEPRFEQRTRQMFEAGLVEEVQGLLKRYPAMTTALQSIGYKEVVRFLEGDLTLGQAQAEVLQATRAYAKRQFTWFRKETGNPTYLRVDQGEGSKEIAACLEEELGWTKGRA